MKTTAWIYARKEKDGATWTVARSRKRIRVRETLGLGQILQEHLV